MPQRAGRISSVRLVASSNKLQLTNVQGRGGGGEDENETVLPHHVSVSPCWAATWLSTKSSSTHSPDPIRGDVNLRGGIKRGICDFEFVSTARIPVHSGPDLQEPHTCGGPWTEWLDH